MKKTLLSVLVFVSIISLSSCVKSHTCTCTYTVSGITQPEEVVTAQSNTADSKTWCTAIQNSLNSKAGVSNITCTVN